MQDQSNEPAGIKLGMAAIKRIAALFPEDRNNPERFVGNVAMILSEYPATVLDHVTDPRTGIVRRHKFMPSIAEIVDACDAEMNRRAILRVAMSELPA